MPAEVIVFPDAVLVVANRLRVELAARGQTMPVGAEVPNPRPARFVRVQRVGGARLNLVVDDPLLSVECWAASDEAAHDLAQLCRGIVHAMPGAVHSGVAVYRVVEAGGPANLPDALSDQPRYLFTVAVAVRGVAS